MNQLVLQVEGKPSLSYVDITPDEETKIETLLRSDSLPTVFMLNGVRIVTDTILGFSDKLSPTENPFTDEQRPPVNQSFFDSVRESAWYQRGLKARQQQGSPTAPKAFSPFA